MLGVKLVLQQDQQLKCLGVLHSMSNSSSIVSIHGNDTGLQLWNQGPRQASDFLEQRCSQLRIPSTKSCLLTYSPACKQQYVAITPDDMLAVQEWQTRGWRQAPSVLTAHQQALAFNLSALEPPSKALASQDERSVKLVLTADKLLFFCKQCNSVLCPL